MVLRGNTVETNVFPCVLFPYRIRPDANLGKRQNNSTNMKRTFLLVAVSLCVNQLLAADSTPKDTLLSASKNLGDKSNYSWKLTVEEPEQSTGTIDGKAEKDGTMFLALARGDQSFEAALKGSRGALKTEDGWKALAKIMDDSAESGRNKFVARLLQNLKAPTAEVAELASKIKELKAVEGGFAGTLTSDTATELFFFHTPPDANRPELKNPKGTVRFWLKDGALSKYQYELQGTLSVNGDDREVKRTHIVEIKEVGSTKVNIPAEAAKEL
jgi:hypothetical protein